MAHAHSTGIGLHTPWGQSGRRGRGFTLIELLVVLAIIVVLIGLVLGSIARARAHALLVQCQSNIGQQLKAHLLYANNWKDYKPPLYRRGVSAVQWDLISPDTKWSNRTVGQGLLVSEGYIPFKILRCPSEAMQDDGERDENAWVNLPNSGSSYVYFWRHVSELPLAPSPEHKGATYHRQRVTARKAIVMDVNAEAGHVYLGEYAGRAWISHPTVRRFNVGYIDGSVRSFHIDEFKLMFAGGSFEELAWFEEAHKRY